MAEIEKDRSDKPKTGEDREEPVSLVDMSNPENGSPKSPTATSSLDGFGRLTIDGTESSIRSQANPLSRTGGNDKGSDKTIPTSLTSSDVTNPQAQAPTTKELVQRFTSDDPSVRQTATKNLREQGGAAVPELRELMKTTESFHSYRKAGDLIKQIEADQQKKEPFSTPYNKEHAQKLSGDLGSDQAVKRERAVDTLSAMGPKVLPDVTKAQQAAAAAGDRTAHRNAEQVIKAVTKPPMEKYKEVASDVKKSFEAAGMKVRMEIVGEIDGVGKIVPTRMLDDPKKEKPSAEVRRGFEDLIKTGDKLAEDKKFLETRRDLDSLSDKDRVAVKGANWATEARVAYARALAGSPDAKDRPKGIDLLVEHLEKRSGKPDYMLKDTARRLGADRDPRFVKAFKARGGDLDD